MNRKLKAHLQVLFGRSTVEGAIALCAEIKQSNLESIDTDAVITASRQIRAIQQPHEKVKYYFGSADSHIGSEQREAVAKAHPEVEIFVYKGAEHGFNRDVWSSYNPEAAKLARQRTSAFFKAHLA